MDKDFVLTSMQSAMGFKIVLIDKTKASVVSGSICQKCGMDRGAIDKKKKCVKPNFTAYKSALSYTRVRETRHDDVTV